MFSLENTNVHMDSVTYLNIKLKCHDNVCRLKVKKKRLQVLVENVG